MDATGRATAAACTPLQGQGPTYTANARHPCGAGVQAPEAHVGRSVGDRCPVPPQPAAPNLGPSSRAHRRTCPTHMLGHAPKTATTIRQHTPSTPPNTTQAEGTSPLPQPQAATSICHAAPPRTLWPTTRAPPYPGAPPTLMRTRPRQPPCLTSTPSSHARGRSLPARATSLP